MTHTETWTHLLPFLVGIDVNNAIMVTTCPPPFSSILSNSSPRSSTGPAHWKKIFHHHDLSLPMESFLSSCSCWKSKAYATSLIALTAWLKHEKLRQLPSQKTKIRWWRISWHLLRLEFWSTNHRFLDMPDITWWIINRQLLPAWNCEAQSTSCVGEHILSTPHHFEALVVWCLNVSLNFEAWLVILSNIATGAATTYKYQVFGGRFKIKLKWFLKNFYI